MRPQLEVGLLALVPSIEGLLHHSLMVRLEVLLVVLLVAHPPPLVPPIPLIPVMPPRVNEANDLGDTGAQVYPPSGLGDLLPF